MIADIALQGIWEFALDPRGEGHNLGWMRQKLHDVITLPGTVDLARKTGPGPSAGMAHLTRRNPYVGAAWYARDIEIPAEQADLYHDLFLERPHGLVRVWLDGVEIGRDLGLCTPNVFLLGKLTSGPHRLVLCIDNSDFPQLGGAHQITNPDIAHSTSDHTQTNWNGIVGAIRIEGRAARIARLDVTARRDAVDLAVELDGLDPNRYWPTFWTDGTPRDEVRVTVTLAGGSVVEHVETVRIDSAFTPLALSLTLPAGTAEWDEFSPVTHQLRAEWWRDGVCLDRRETVFGLRRIERAGRHILLNGRRIFLRGTLDCAIFPKTGHPPTDHTSWRKVYDTLRRHGLNHMRFHSWCPPRAAFDMADKMGIYLHVESPVWCVLGADPALDALVRQEAERIVATYGNHPSFIMLTVGNEIAGEGLHAWLERFLDHWRMADPRRLYGGGSGWPTLKRADYLSKPEPRSHRWGEGVDSRLNARAFETQTDWSDWVGKCEAPLLGHEIGQWCVYPDLAAQADYDGPLANDAFDIVARDLRAKGRIDQAREKLMCSGALQTALYKEDIEASLRTPDYGGFQLLGLQDFSGQGTALVGVVDAFWQDKPYDDAAAFRRFCGPVVPLIRADGFVLTVGQRFAAQGQLCCFCAEDLAASEAGWRLLDAQEQPVREGALPHGPLKTGELHDLGEITFDTAGLAQGRYTLEIEAGGASNGWDIWVFGQGEAELPLITRLGAEEIARVVSGETLVFCPPVSEIAPNAVLGHTAIFWNTVWTKGQPPHTLGLINRLDHPVFSTFPATAASGWHQWELTHGRRAFDLAGYGFGRIIDVIDDWNQNRDLALLAEAQVGAGRLVISAVDLVTPGRPVAAALGRALADSIAQGQADAPRLAPDAVLAWASTALLKGA